MKNLTILILFISSFSCSNRHVLVNEMELQNDLFYLKNEIKPFTGICMIPLDDENVLEIRSFVKGKLNGEASTYYNSGELKRKGNYLDSQYHGIWTQWYKNGNKEFEIAYSNGKMKGDYTIWYRNGEIKEKGTYEDNYKTGTWTIYNERGDIIEKRKYD